MEKEENSNKRKASDIEVEETQPKRTNTLLVADALRLELSRPIGRPRKPPVKICKDHPPKLKPVPYRALDFEDVVMDEDHPPIEADKFADTSPGEETNSRLIYPDDDSEMKALADGVTKLFQKVAAYTRYLKNAVVPHHLVVRSDHGVQQMVVDIYRSFFNLEEPCAVKVKILGLDEKNHSIRDLNVLLKLAPKESRLKVLWILHTTLNEQLAWLEPLVNRCWAIAEQMKRMDFKPNMLPIELGTVWSTKLHPVVCAQDLNWGNKFQAGISKQQSADWLLWSSVLVAMLKFLQ
jgi:hypothetical protein